MGKKHDRIAAKAKKTVAARHSEKAEEDASMPKPVAVAAKAAKVKEVKEGALPALPKLPSAARLRKPRPTQPCACGCETPTTGMWAPGHDARAKGWAIRIERGICKMSDVPANEQAGAKHMLKARKDAPEPVKGGKIKLAKSDKAEARDAEAEVVAADASTEAVNE